MTAKFELKKVAKFELLPNSKLPACKWSDKKNHVYDGRLQENKNYGIITGKLNNLLVLDIDVKDHGLEEWKKYIERNGEPNTVTVSTPSGGLHYYFLYHSKNEANEQLLRDYLYTQTKLRNVGIDIRSDGGYVVGPHSIINNKQYLLGNSAKNNIIEMPTELILWLLEGRNSNNNKETVVNKATSTVTIQRSPNNGLVYMIDDAKLSEFLAMLPKEYHNNYLKWLSVTNILKGLDKQDMWDNFSKKSKKYNKTNNIVLWNNLISFLNVNYLISIINSLSSSEIPTLELIESYKPYEPFTTSLEQFNIKEFNKQYVSDGFLFKEFQENSTIIVESCTGTGKTTATAKYFKELHEKNTHLRILSLVNKISLADQHVKSFHEQGINMVSYENKDKNLYTDHLVVCINSIRILNDLPLEVLKNKVVYIDEINSFLESVTHNDTLVNDVRTIFLTLAKVIKCAHKVVFSDALINDAIMYLVNWRTEFYPEKAFFVRNTFKKYDHIEAINVKNEDEFLEKLLNACKTEKGFLFGCDSKSTITNYYNKCFSEATEEEQKNFILITADSKMKIEDASVEFKEKYVFYSPSITTGIDFSIKEKQNVYIYVNGKSILSNSIFQQTTRTRNINKLFYYCNNTTHKVQFCNVEDVEKHYSEILNINSTALKDVCVTVDENDQQKVIQNTFFKLFCYNEYVKDVYKSNIKIHFEQLLQQNGFVLSTMGEKKKLEKEMKGEMKGLTEEIETDTFDSFIKASENDKTKAKYKPFMDRIKILHLNVNDEEELLKYSDEIGNEKSFRSHLTFCRLLQNDDYLKGELEKKHENSYDIAQLTCTVNKILHIRKLEETYEMGYLNVMFDGNDSKIEFDEGVYKMIKTLFRTEKGKPKNLNDVKKLYLSMLKNVTGVKFINAKKINSKKNQNVGKYVHSLNEKVIRDNVKLMLKRYRVEDKDDLQRFHKGAFIYLPKFDKAYYFGKGK
jgi:hypothetical protein